MSPQASVPLVSLAVAFATGIGVASLGSASLGSVSIGICLLVAVASAITIKSNLRVALALVTLWAVAGWLRVADDPQTTIAPGLVQIEGIVREHRLVYVAADRTRYGVAADYTRISVAVSNSTARSLTGQTVDMFVAGHAVNIAAGDTVRTLAVADTRPPPANPGERWTHKVNTPFLRVDHPNAIAVIPATGWAGYRNRVRAGLADVILDNLPPKEAGIAMGLMLGRRDRVDDSVADAVRQTGTGHLLAISGLHLGLLAWLLLQVVRRITRSLRWQTIAVCGLMILYIAIVEPRASVQRAGVFALLMGVAVLLGRQVASLNLLAAAAIIVLVIDPHQLFMPGAQLSFAAVLSILAVVRFKIIERFTPSWFQVDEMTSWGVLRQAIKPIYQMTLWGILIWAATSPLAAYHFRWVTAWGAILHLFCFVPVALAMMLLFVAIFASLWTSIATPLWAVAAWLLSLFATIVESTASWGILSTTVARPDALLIGSLYAGLLGVLATRKHWLSNASIAVITVSAIALVSTSLSPTLHTRLNGWQRPKDAARIAVISVGHGLCILTQTPTGHAVLYDAGSLASPERTGTKIADTLLALGVRKIDTLIVSHADQDHFGSVPELIDLFPISEVRWHPTFAGAESWSVDQTRRAIKDAGIATVITSAGDTFAYGDVQFRVLHPTADQAFEEDNGNSLVISVEYAGRRVLLTGDVEEEGADALMSSDISKTDVLLAPHHGGRTANTPSFADWARPAVVISSSGRSAKDNLATIYAGTPLFETLTDGAVFATIHADGRMHVNAFRGRQVKLDRRDD